MKRGKAAEGEVNLEFRRAHKNKRKEAKLSQGELGGRCLKLNLPRSDFPCPDFLADFL